MSGIVRWFMGCVRKCRRSRNSRGTAANGSNYRRRDHNPTNKTTGNSTGWYRNNGARGKSDECTAAAQTWKCGQERWTGNDYDNDDNDELLALKKENYKLLMENVRIRTNQTKVGGTDHFDDTVKNHLDLTKLALMRMDEFKRRANELTALKTDYFIQLTEMICNRLDRLGDETAALKVDNSKLWALITDISMLLLNLADIFEKSVDRIATQWTDKFETLKNRLDTLERAGRSAYQKKSNAGNLTHVRQDLPADDKLAATTRPPTSVSTPSVNTTVSLYGGYADSADGHGSVEVRRLTFLGENVLDDYSSDE